MTHDTHQEFRTLTYAEVALIKHHVNAGRFGRSLDWVAVCSRPTLAIRVLNAIDEGDFPYKGGK